MLALPNVKHPNYNLKTNNKRLIVSDITVILGIHLDPKLHWKSHLLALKAKTQLRIICS